VFTLAHIRPTPPLLIGEHTLGAASVSVFLQIRAAGNHLSATLTAVHTDPEGTSLEHLDAAPALEAQGELELFAYLDSIEFPSGILASPNRYDDLIEHASALF
jgi:hypothetical protein